MSTKRVILHPTDFSKHAQAALEVACAVARERSAKLLVLHVVPSHEPLAHFQRALGIEPPDEAQHDLKLYQAEMQKKLETVRAPDAVVEVVHLMKEGAVGPTIVRTASENDCIMVVMGTRGYSAMARALFGSVADEVCRGARCPVVTVQVPGG